jgi:uncharacterized protein (TIGR02646 family)
MIWKYNWEDLPLIYIEKNAEPQSLKAHRNTPGADFDSLDKTELRTSLLEEQGYLCAYCMKRINDAKNTKIEHYEARNDENQLLYTNLHAVCTGNEKLQNQCEKVNPKKFTCDTMKKNQMLHVNPQNRADMETLYYDLKGKIYSTNSDYQKDLDMVLNLNDPYGYLNDNRQAALKAVQNQLIKLKPGQDAKPLLYKIQNLCCVKNSIGELPEFVGIIRWYIERQIRKHG